jgi:hypothetical protein
MAHEQQSQGNSSPIHRPSINAPAVIDLQALAEKVYQLMLADLRSERTRGATARRKER